MLGLLTDGADETRASLLPQWKHREKIRLVKCDVNFAIHRRTAGLHIRDIKQVSVRAAGETDLQGLADWRAGAVASGKVCRGTHFLGSIRLLQACAYLAGVLLESDELRLALDFDAVLGEAIQSTI